MTSMDTYTHCPKTQAIGIHKLETKISALRNTHMCHVASACCDSFVGVSRIDTLSGIAPDPLK